MRSDHVDGDNTVRILRGSDRLKRVRIIERSDSVYVVRAESWYQNVFEGKVVAEGWKPIHRDFGLFGSADLAEREALVTFDWLMESPRPR